jgi:hypothetical protein
MIQLLFWLTTIINIAGLAISLCLSLYIVTRTPKSRRSWLAALTLWSLTCLFCYNALSVVRPGGRTIAWLRPVSIAVLPLWYHLALVLPPAWTQQRFRVYLPPMRLPAVVQRRLGRLSPIVSRSVVLLAYILALVLLILGVLPLGQFTMPDARPPVLLSDRTADQLFPLSTAFLAVLGSLALLNLWLGLRGARTAIQKRGFVLLLVATVLAGFGGLYLGLGVSLSLPLPSLVSDFAVVAAAALLGYTVAERNALLEGRDIVKDLLYIALAIGSLTALCVLIAQSLYVSGHDFSFLSLIVIIIAAISCLMLYDGMRTTLDRLFYREQFRQLRANLRALAREAGVGQSLPKRLQAVLSALCRTLQASKGVLAIRQGAEFVCEAAIGVDLLGKTYRPPSLAATEMVDLPRSDTAGPEGMALLAPIYAGEEQIGALVLGSKETGAPYSEDDLMLVDDLVDELAAVIRASQLQEENVLAITEMVADFRERDRALQRQMQQLLAEREGRGRPILEGIGDKELVSFAEDALRRLYDFSYLGEQPLAQLKVVDWHLQGRQEEFVTHLDRGKALSEVLTQALSKLRPQGEEPKPHTVPTREWHQFITLYDAYVMGELNRDIMSRLYISEGTFNRTRRRAVRSVAKALQEMEREASQRKAA